MITLLQQDIAWAQPAANRQAAKDAILSTPGSDLYVLPEMWDYGFSVKPCNPAYDPEGTIQWMKDMARATNAAIAGSVATPESGKWYNRLHFVMPDGGEAHYDKRHTFTYGGEGDAFERGTLPTIAEWRGVRYLLQICYDLRFPAFSRNAYAAGSPTLASYDCILYVASWPSSRRHVWDTLLRARAIENQCYVCGINRIGSDPLCHYDGGTVCIDPYGNTLSSCTDGKAGTASVEIDVDGLRRFREKFPVLRDADHVCLDATETRFSCTFSEQGQDLPRH